VRFAATAPRWEEADSVRLVLEVPDRVTQAGWRPIHGDLTMHAQRPNLST
jgi:2C-methyl-D-erythritol 2,4-cyclodiphosphate synthase